MSNGVFAFLRRDLRSDLIAGVARTPVVPADGVRWLQVLALGCVVAGLSLNLACGYHAGFLRINAWAAGAPSWVWQWLTALGDERVPFALALLFSRRYPQVFWALVVAGLIGIAYTHLGKYVVDALRPPAVLDPGSFNLIGPKVRRISFPSGHSATAGVFFGVLVSYARPAWARALLVALALGVGLSRVAVGVHWPVDVAAGLAGGVLAAWLGVVLADRRRWGALDPSSHLAFVTLAVLFTLSLTYWDGGYHLARGLLLVIGALGLAQVAVGYGAAPMVRWWRLAPAGGLDEAAIAAGELNPNTLPAARSLGGREHRDFAGEYPP
jgi:membrane-associated phospholipid phosphatase